MDLLMIITLIGIGVAGLAAILAIWMERDPRRPMKFAAALSVLILMATGVMILQSVLDAKSEAEKEAQAKADKEKLQGDLARMMQTLDSMASESDDPKLQAFLSSELEAQARSNPEVVQKLAQRYADEGEDPAEKLGKHIGSSEVEKLARKGKLKTKKKKTSVPPKKEKKEEEKKIGRPAPSMARPAAVAEGEDEEKEGEEDAPTPQAKIIAPGGTGAAPAALKGLGLSAPAADKEDGDKGDAKLPRGSGSPKGLMAAPAKKDGDEADPKGASTKSKKKKKKKKKKAATGLSTPKLGF